MVELAFACRFGLILLGLFSWQGISEELDDIDLQSFSQQFRKSLR